MNMKDLIKEEIKNALISMDYYDEKIDIILSTPKNKDFGDLATNISFILAKKLGLNPIEIANDIKKKMNKSDLLNDISVINPGFINFFLNPQYLNKKLKQVISKNKTYGSNKSGKNKRVLIEFVSANPTGPLTVGHGRGAILGDVIANILTWNGYQVDREYYYNNAGRQMRILGESVQARYFEILGQEFNFPEDGYHGSYIKDIAKNLVDKKNDAISKDTTIDVFKKEAENFVFNQIKKTLATLKINFNYFFNEKTLYKNKKIDDVIKRLKKKNLIYEKDGAIWFNAIKAGRESDRVLIKSTGEPTYRLPDMAYHITKMERGYDLCVDIFGADHMDAYPDVLAVLKELEYDDEKIIVLIHQFISIIKDGETVKMSTRKGTFITLDELINEVGIDVTRYFFIMRNINSHLNFDLNIAKEKSEKNPVFYIQYAHARIMNIKKNIDFNYKNANLDLLNNNEETKLISKILDFENLIYKSAELKEPQLLCNYLFDLSSMFHKYYAKNRIINENLELSKARIILIEAIRITINNGLDILGISSPKKM
ncbi:MAG: arginine--tRNA ligase [Candidatus Marinimicrobia bacterium]|nr:arginine--tRNA ligase [Candidatus Neomarinimicrobiota bacterium]